MLRGSIVGAWRSANGVRFVFGSDGNFLWTSRFEDTLGSASPDKMHVLLCRGRWTLGADGIIAVVPSEGVYFGGVPREDTSFTIVLESIASSKISIRVQLAMRSEQFVLRRDPSKLPEEGLFRGQLHNCPARRLLLRSWYAQGRAKQGRLRARYSGDSYHQLSASCVNVASRRTPRVQHSIPGTLRPARQRVKCY